MEFGKAFQLENMNSWLFFHFVVLICEFYIIPGRVIVTYCQATRACQLDYNGDEKRCNSVRVACERKDGDGWRSVKTERRLRGMRVNGRTVIDRANRRTANALKRRKDS